jgi:hypothetical protein
MLISTAHPYDPATVNPCGRDLPMSDQHPRHSRAGVIVSYRGPTNTRGAVWHGSIKRNVNDRAITATVPSYEGPDAAAKAVLVKAELNWRLLPAACLDGGDRYAYAAELSAGEGAALAQGERGILAMHACQLMGHRTAPYGSARIVADMATGQRRPEPIVAGWCKGHPILETVTVKDHLGRDLFTLGDRFAPIHAMACARAAGWILSADSLDLAKKWVDELGQVPDAAGVALARTAWEARS